VAAIRRGGGGRSAAGVHAALPNRTEPVLVANPYEATDPVNGPRFDLRPLLPDLGATSPAPGGPFAPGTVENPWEVEAR
jgi:hypothetical protein